MFVFAHNKELFNKQNIKSKVDIDLASGTSQEEQYVFVSGVTLGFQFLHILVLCFAASLLQTADDLQVQNALVADEFGKGIRFVELRAHI